MRKIILISLCSLAALQLPLFSQDRIRANINNRGGDGRCTFEVEVDGVAEVEIRGDSGYLRTISGNPARWRRLDCNQALPGNPGDFRFRGVDGRGRQDLVRDPGSNRGVAVIRIEDPKSGSQGYTGDITWRGGSGNPGGGWGNPGGSWGGSGSGGSWNGDGWNNSWGSNIRYNGRGSGSFDRDSGPRYDLRNADINVDRSGRVTANFDTDQGRNTLRFEGRVTRSRNDSIEADLTSADHRGDRASARGRIRIQVGQNRAVQSIDMDGNVSDRQFRLNWRNSGW